MGLFSSKSSSSTTNVTNVDNTTLGADAGSIAARDSHIEILDAGAIGRAFDFAEKNTDFLERSTEDVLGFSDRTRDEAYRFAEGSRDTAYDFARFEIAAAQDFARQAQAVAGANVESIATKNAILAGSATNSASATAARYGVYALLTVALLVGATALKKRRVAA